jgi:hypothetical protein
MSLSDLFARFGAPLANTRWAWGSVKPDGTVFLRVWTDEMKTVDGRRYVRLINRQAYEGADDNLGYAERCEHVRMLINGAPGYAVLCRAAEPRARSREIVSFDAQTVFRLGGLAVYDGDEWAEVVERVPVREITRL